MSSVLAHIFDRRRIVVCVGSGGVGKTTTAAALALRAALAGKKTLVLTIDPAKRLANSLGLTELGHDVQRVDDAHLDAAAAAAGFARTPGGELHAMMLDQKRAFDEIVESHASNPEAVKRILANPVYAQISGSLAGTQEYAAMAKLHEFDQAGQFEAIVVDTPPTAHALDFLDAPEKLTEAIDSPAIEWFRKVRSGGKGGWSLIGNTGSYVISRLSKFVGTRFIDDLAVFFSEFNDILGGFRVRAQETFRVLRQDHVGFVLVASPDPMAVEEALFFFDRLRASQMPFDSFVVNKVHRDLPISSQLGDLDKKLATEPAVAALGYQPATLHMAAEAMLACHSDLQILAAADRKAIAQLRQRSSSLVEVPFQGKDVHDLGRLARLGSYLFETNPAPLH